MGFIKSIFILGWIGKIFKKIIGSCVDVIQQFFNEYYWYSSTIWLWKRIISARNPSSNFGLIFSILFFLFYSRFFSFQELRNLSNLQGQLDLFEQILTTDLNEMKLNEGIVKVFYIFQYIYSNLPSTVIPFPS